MEELIVAEDYEPIPCKGCGEILDEGKAYELAGLRWHIHCFCCNTCGSLLDSDANLLLLGDGSLICSNCTYNCTACGNKIEDLAILTGDQAFCSTCFRCRKCKRKIENLRYARTSQGIFCMSCHESIMARRKKRHQAAAQAKSKDGASPMITDKSLPALPPSTPINDHSPRPSRVPYTRPGGDAASSSSSTHLRPDRPDRPERPERPDRSPHDMGIAELSPDTASAKESLTLPARGYRNNRNSAMYGSGSMDLGGGTGDGDSFFIPLALDTGSTPSAATPRSVSESVSDTTTTRKPRDGDYFSVSDDLKSPDDTKSVSSQATTPHIAFLDKSASSSTTAAPSLAATSDYSSSRAATPKEAHDLKAQQLSRQLSSKTARTELSMSSMSVASTTSDEHGSRGGDGGFKLQDAPRVKKMPPPSTPRIGTNQPSSTSANNNNNNNNNSTWREKERDRVAHSPATSTSTSIGGPGAAPSRSSQDTRRGQNDDDDTRSFVESAISAASSRHSLGTSGAQISRKELMASARTANGKPISSPIAKQPNTNEVTSPSMPPRPPPPRPGMNEPAVSTTYMQPRAPPQPPTNIPPATAPTVPTMPSRTPVTPKEAVPIAAAGGNGAPGSPATGPSPTLPRWSSGGDFSLDEDMARILGTDETSSNILRRVSKAVRHGRNNSTESSNVSHGGNGASPRGHNRSVSETTRTTGSPHWSRVPIAEDDGDDDGLHGISSPMSPTGAKDDAAHLKRRLRSSEQRVAELERQFGAEKDLKTLNKKLMEKRRTVSVLDTQAEIMIRQLEVLAGYVERAKTTKEPIDMRSLEDSAIKDFVQKLDTLRADMTATIEQLHEERDELMEEKNQAVADRDRALLEFEQLSSKNAQLADMNNDLTHQIQERFKSQIGGAEQQQQQYQQQHQHQHQQQQHQQQLMAAAQLQQHQHQQQPIKSPNGLGIYHPQKGPSISSMSNIETASIQTSGNATLVGHDSEEPIVESGPTVVNIRKGQVRKFNWKKGSKTVAQGLSKGVNRAVGAFQNDRDQRNPAFQGLTGDSIGMPYNMTVTAVDSPAAFAGNTPTMQSHSEYGGSSVNGGGGETTDGAGAGGNGNANGHYGGSSVSGGSGGGGGGGSSGGGASLGPNQQGAGAASSNGGGNSNGYGNASGGSVTIVANGNNLAGSSGGGGGFGFFKKGGNVAKSGTMASLMNQAPAPAEPPSTLFGSDLVERADYERRQIPSVVTRCIEEVELRGMDVEGIYRKTGGTSQVKAIQEGFEKQEDYDISDPDFDITAVTSVLKQYFRRLPNPLLTFAVYDRVLESTTIAGATERCTHLRRTFNTLPPKHRDCLEFLVFHLARVANRERENLMSPKNLAVVFAPTIMRDLNIEREMTDMHAKNQAVQFIIENSDGIFGEP